MLRFLKFFDKLQIRNKVLAGYALMILFLLILATAAGVLLHRIDARSEAVIHEITPIVGVLRDLKFSGMQLMKAVDTTIIVVGIDAYIDDEQRQGYLADEGRAIDVTRQDIVRALRAYGRLSQDQDKADTDPLRAIILAHGEAVLAAAEKFSGILHNNSNSISKLLQAEKAIDEAYAAFAVKVEAALDDESAELAANDGAVRALMRHSVDFLIVVTLVAIGAAFLAARFISNRIARPVLRLRDETRRVAEGQAATIDLEVGSDEIGELTRAFGGMLHQLNESTEKRVAVMRQVASTVSHELRNPLAAIRTSVAVLQHMDAEQGGRSQAIFERIDRTIQRCTRIIMSLVDYTHLEDIERQSIEVDVWASNWLARQKLPESIDLRCEMTSPVIVEIDPDRLGQALGNLIDNAIHAVTEAVWEPPADHQPRIVVRTEASDDQVRVLVSDNGCGIPAENLSRVFEPLFTTKNFGVGLGLSLVKQIVEFHGGSIAMTSTAGAGTTVTISLPQRAAGDVTLFDDEPAGWAPSKAA
jgi:signal transduction histidine kinase